MDCGLWTVACFRPNFFKPPPLAVVVAEDVNGVTLPQPAVELVEKFAALRLGNLRIRRAFAKWTKGVERGKWSAEVERWNSSTSASLSFEADSHWPFWFELGEKISPRNKKWIIFGDLPRVFVGGRRRVVPVRTGEKWFHAGGNPEEWRAKPSFSEGRVARDPVSFSELGTRVTCPSD